MIARGLRCSSVAALFAALSVWAAPARADVIYDLDLEVSDGQLPTELCVVANTLLPTVLQPVGLEVAPTRYDVSSGGDYVLESVPSQADRQSGSQQRSRFVPRSQGSGCPSASEWCEAATAVPSCTPQFSFPPSRAASRPMACFSLRPGAEPQRYLVLWVDGSLLQPPRVVLSRVELRLSDASQIAVLGGSFRAPSAKAPLLSKLASGARGSERLTLQPRCVSTRLELPFAPFEPAPGSASPAPPGSLNLKLELTDNQGKMELLRPVAPGEEQLSLPMPNVGPAELKATLLPGATPGQARAAESSQDPPTRLVARWAAPGTPERIGLLPQKFSFRWQRHCLYPEGAECPGATIAGTSWAGTPDGRFCRYEPEIAEGVAFPVTVQFLSKADRLRPSPAGSKAERTPALRWEGHVRTPGAVLFDYVDPADRRLSVQYAWEEPPANRSRTWHDRVDAVDIQLPSGKRWRLRPEWGNREISAPDLICEDNATFQYVGAREYKVVGANVIDGVLKLEDPSESLAQSVSLAFSLGGGLQRTLHFEGSDTRPFGAAEVAFTFASHRAMHLELRAGVLWGHQEYRVSSTSGPRSRPGFDERSTGIGYVRIPVEGLILWDPGWGYVGAGTGIALGNYLFTVDARRVLRRVLLPLRGLLGVHITRYVGLELDAHSFLFERALAADYGDFSGDPEVQSAAIATIFWGLWLRFIDPL